MTEPITRLMMLIRDLLELPESRIHRGRTGAEWEYSTDLHIAVDSLAPSEIIGKGEYYDGHLEKLTLESTWRQVFTVNIFGSDAHECAMKLHHYLVTTPSKILQFKHEIAVSQAGQITDVKQLTQHEYINRLELQLTTNYKTRAVIDTLRIDSVPYPDQNSENQKWLTLTE